MDAVVAVCGFQVQSRIEQIGAAQSPRRGFGAQGAPKTDSFPMQAFIAVHVPHARSNNQNALKFHHSMVNDSQIA